MNYLYVKYPDYINYIKENNNNDRLFKNLKIYTTSKEGIINEIFNEPLYTNYKIEKNTTDILISFNTNSNNKYRLDIFKIIEKDKSKNFINHIAFSDYTNNINDIDKYEELLKRNEMIEILNRIHYILKDLISNNIINNSFCIGGTKLLSKNNIYQYLLKIIVGNNGFQKLNSEIYTNTKFGLYFKV